MKTLRLATRKSELALAQSTLVGQALIEAHGASKIGFELLHVVTTGDRKQGTAEAAVSDKREWVLEIERAVVSGQADFAVHSGKDVPLVLEPGTTLAPVLERRFPFDALLVSPALRAKNIGTLKSLPAGARVGTASLRREAHLRRLRSDLTVLPLRGNVTTRLAKLLDGGEYDAIILAAAGLDRLGLADHISEIVPAEMLLPAVSQGTLVVQWRTDDESTASLLSPLTRSHTLPPFLAERELIAVLGADCKSAVSSYAELHGEQLSIRGRVLSLDGSRCLEAARTGAWSSAHELAREVGAELLALGAADLL